MTFEIHSDITNRSMTVAARAMRRVLRRKRSIVWTIFGWSVFVFNALLLIPFDGEPFALDEPVWGLPFRERRLSNQCR